MAVTFTPSALAKVKELIQTQQAPGLRVACRGGGCSGFEYVMNFDHPKTLDKIVSVEGIQVFIDQMSLLYLDGTEIDYVDNLMGSGFKFNNPNHRHCGCGHSFSV